LRQLIQTYKTGELSIVEVPTPECRENGVLVRTAVSLISTGTEKNVVDTGRRSLIGNAMARPDLVHQVLDKVRQEGLAATAKKVFNKMDTPVALGYSCSGRIIETGKNVNEFRVGDLVACGGAGYASHAEINYVPVNLCVRIPDNLGPEEGAFTTLGAIAMQGIRRCELSPGEKVAVLGLGLIGQLTVQILSAYGFPALGIDIDEKKVAKSLSLGLEKGAVIGKDNVEEIANSFSGGYGVDAVIITASTSSNDPVRLAGRISRARGRVSVVGLVGMEIPRDIYYEKELDLYLSRSYGPGRYDVNYEEKGKDYPYAYVRWTEKRNMEEFLRLVASGLIDLKAMTTHKFKFEEYLKGYELIMKNPNKEDYSGILLLYGRNIEQKPFVTIQNKSRHSHKEDEVRIGLIGCGNFAKNVILPNLYKIKGADIEAVASAGGRNAEAVARKYKCRYSTADYNQILNDKEINSVFIATRHDLHSIILLAALKKGKNVFLEKPLCINMDELKEIAAFTAEINRAQGPAPVIMVGFNRRFSPQAAAAKKRFSNRANPLMINYRMNAGYIPAGHWVHDPEEGGGRIVGEVCHALDLLNFLIGALPVKLYATALPPKGSILPDDNVSISIDYSDGSRANIIYTAMGGKNLNKEYIEIFGDRSSIVIDDFRSGRFGHSQDKGHFWELKAFIESVLSGAPSPIPLDDILLATLMSFKIHESVQTGGPVEISLDQLLPPGK
jgi:predicted dehydrogenase/threonine dehydrogenase-like Zn-dependent dehydrogenase